MKKYSLIVPNRVETLGNIKNYGKAHDFVWRNIGLTEEPDEKVFYLYLKVKSKRTDVFRDLFSPEGLLVSPKLKLILEKFKLPEHRFYPATIVHKNKEYEYHWLQISMLLSMPFKQNPVNKTKTVISSEEDSNTYAYQLGSKQGKDVESPSEMADIGDKSEVWLYQNLLPYDIFRVQNTIRSKFCLMPFIISQELKAALIENKITGIGIIDANIQAE
jgi:hypothetical protein